jgi:hypothetical protein
MAKILRKIVLFCCLVSIFLFSFGTVAWAKHFFMILHYDKGVISVNKDNILQIRDDDVSVEKRTYIGPGNRIYRCNVLNSKGEILFSSSVEIPLVMMWDGLDENGNQTGGQILLEQTDFGVSMPYVDNAAVIKIVSQYAADTTGKTLVEKLVISKDKFIDVSTTQRPKK